MYYSIESTGAWYEANKKISIFIKDDSNRCCLHLPEIYFQTIDENGKKICYIYAIQTSKYEKYWNKDNMIEDSLIHIKRQLRNKYVNYKFVLALEIFIKILRENDFYDIKVPLLQLLNYDYHINMSESYKNKIALLNAAISEGRGTYDDHYKYVKEKYDKIADKEDIISKNKTERLIGAFMVLEEKFGDINILNDPFIEDESLLIKVLNLPKSKKIKKN